MQTTTGEQTTKRSAIYSAALCSSLSCLIVYPSHSLGTASQCTSENLVSLSGFANASLCVHEKVLKYYADLPGVQTCW